MAFTPCAERDMALRLLSSKHMTIPFLVATTSLLLPSVIIAPLISSPSSRPMAISPLFLTFWYFEICVLFILPFLVTMVTYLSQSKSGQVSMAAILSSPGVRGSMFTMFEPLDAFEPSASSKHLSLYIMPLLVTKSMLSWVEHTSISDT